MNHTERLTKRLASGAITVMIVVVLSLGTGMLTSSAATAMIREHEEAPGQVLYKSQWSLRDQHQQPWQAIAFKQIYPDRVSDVYLRLVGFPGAVILDHTQPLTLTPSMEQPFTLADEVDSLFPDDPSSAANVGQYRLQVVLSKLRPELPLELSLRQTDGEVIALHVPPWLVKEWQQLLAD